MLAALLLGVPDCQQALPALRAAEGPAVPPAGTLHQHQKDQHPRLTHRLHLAHQLRGEHHLPDEDAGIAAGSGQADPVSGLLVRQEDGKGQVAAFKGIPDHLPRQVIVSLF